MTEALDQCKKIPVYDKESGLGVQWVRDERPMERYSHFLLLIGERAVPFGASFSFGVDFAKRENPKISVSELFDLMRSDHVMVYKAQQIDAEFDREKFVGVWQRLVSRGMSHLQVGVVYSEWNEVDRSWRKWSKEVPAELLRFV